MDIFELAFSFSKQWEGGYVNNPKDPGGETNFGISKRAYPNLDIKHLTLGEAKEIYRKDYWEKLPNISNDGLKIAAFDTAINVGIRRTTLWLANVAVKSASDLISIREEYYKTLVEKKPTLKIFLKGWLNRTRDLSIFIGKL